MNLWKYTFPSILSASVLAGGLYFVTDTEPKHEWVKILTDTVAHRTQNTISPFWDTKIYWIPSEIASPVTITQTKDPIDELLWKNPTLKQRIQWTSWYRDYLTGKLDKSTVERFILDAYSIEERLKQNPWVIDKIQYEAWWQKYIRWDTNPSDMLIWNMQAYFDLSKIQQDNLELYTKASFNQHWNTWVQYGEDYIVVWQRELIISLSLRLTYLDANPDIEKKLQEKWFTRDNLFKDDWSKWEWIYEYLNSMQDEKK